MSDLAIFTGEEGELLIDSRLIAERLGIEHESFLKTLDTHQTQIERAFGVLRFEVGKPKKGSQGGRPSKFAFLNEDQATFLMTLSRNTPEVIQCKVDLVTAFAKAKAALAPKTQAELLHSFTGQMVKQERQLAEQEARVHRLEASRDEADTRIAAVEAEQERYKSPCGHKYAVLAFGIMNGFQVSGAQAASLGKKATAICKNLGIEIEQIRDPRFGKVNIYPESVLRQIFGLD